MEEGPDSERGTPTPTPSPTPLGSISSTGTVSTTTSTACIDELEAALKELLHSEKWNAALTLVRRNRNCWTNDLSISPEDDDIVTALNIYCKNLICNRPGKGKRSCG